MSFAKPPLPGSGPHLFEGRKVLVARRNNRIGNIPRIRNAVPTYPSVVRRRVFRGHVIDYDRSLTKREKTMRHAGRKIHGGTALRKLQSEAPAKRRRVDSHVDENVLDNSRDAIHKLRVIMRRLLEMHAAQNISRGSRVELLYKVGAQAFPLE